MSNSRSQSRTNLEVNQTKTLQPTKKTYGDPSHTLFQNNQDNALFFERYRYIRENKVQKVDTLLQVRLEHERQQYRDIAKSLHHYKRKDLLKPMNKNAKPAEDTYLNFLNKHVVDKQNYNKPVMVHPFQRKIDFSKKEQRDTYAEYQRKIVLISNLDWKELQTDQFQTDR